MNPALTQPSPPAAPRYIREGRFGLGKTFKTGAVCGTYPRPLLCLQFDPGGMDILREPVTFLSVADLRKLCAEKRPSEEGKIYAIDFSAMSNVPLTVEYKPMPDSKTFPAITECVNLLCSFCPFKTVVLDGLTGLSECIYGHQSATNPAFLGDARKWAGNIGMKAKQVIGYLHMLPCHTVVLMHSETSKDELTSITTEQPMMYSKVRDLISTMFSQFFYSGTRENPEKNKPPIAYILTQPKAMVRGLGPRWPENLPAECGARYDDIYNRKP